MGRLMQPRSKMIEGGAMLLLALGLGAFACDGEHGGDGTLDVNEGGASGGVGATAHQAGSQGPDDSGGAPDVPTAGGDGGSLLGVAGQGEALGGAGSASEAGAAGVGGVGSGNASQTCVDNPLFGVYRLHGHKEVLATYNDDWSTATLDPQEGDMTLHIDLVGWATYSIEGLLDAPGIDVEEGLPPSHFRGFQEGTLWFPPVGKSPADYDIMYDWSKEPSPGPNSGASWARISFETMEGQYPNYVYGFARADIDRTTGAVIDFAYSTGPVIMGFGITHETKIRASGAIACDLTVCNGSDQLALPSSPASYAYTPSFGTPAGGTPEAGVYHLTSVLHDDELCELTAPLYETLSVSVSSPTEGTLNLAKGQPEFGGTLRSSVDFKIKDGSLGPSKTLFDLCGQSIPWGDPVTAWGSIYEATSTQLKLFGWDPYGCSNMLFVYEKR
jgi:hypothetical protein